jgi:hypothetical protein
VRDQLIETLGLPVNSLVALNERPQACVNPASGTEVRTAPRWNTWRADDETVCVVFPQVATPQINTEDLQVMTLDLTVFPFEFMNVPEVYDLTAANLEVALWSLTNPGDVQWVNATEVTQGVATFAVPVPIEGWQGDLLAAHYFIDGQFLFQQIWQIQGLGG